MRLVMLNAALLTLVAVAIVGVEVWDRPEAAVESSVRRYAAAVSNADLDAAMAEIAPPERAAWTDWVEGQLGNIYNVTGVAVRAGSVLGKPTEVTTGMDINRGDLDQFYKASPRVPVEEVDGRWYLSAPLLSTQ